MIEKRVRLVKDGKSGTGPVVYWMSRDQRVADNWALLYAQRLALRNQVPLVVVFCLVPSFLGATIRHYAFMLKGLQEVESGLQKKHIPFFLVSGHPEKRIRAFLRHAGASILVSDFDPLKIKKQWKASLAETINIPFFEVDAQNIVPCLIASRKQEYAAYTLRPKLKKLLPEYLVKFPPLRKHPFLMKRNVRAVNWKEAHARLNVDTSVGEIKWLTPGERAAKKMLRVFIDKKLHSYATDRNDPNADGQSNLSPYLHFGQISAQRIALKISAISQWRESRDAFLEELIVRRELSDNFCQYNERYDSFEGFPGWAQQSLRKYRNKPREYVYSLKQFEHAETHDALWNAAQTEMVIRGKMHGYLRMYWAKKILEWTESPERALEIAIYLNDKYELDGRDPNGYTGIAWSIGGVHDRAWNERRVFGKVRYMSYNGCKGKFDVNTYIKQHSSNE